MFYKWLSGVFTSKMNSVMVVTIN